MQIGRALALVAGITLTVAIALVIVGLRAADGLRRRSA
jgi:multisubunit Na+/H+ antiporter MnhB subunit